MGKLLITLLIIIITVIVFLLLNKLYIRFSNPFLLPILTTTILMVSLLSVFNISYDTYMVGGEWINQLLGPAVVALAFPLYKQWNILKEHIFTILGGVFLGVLCGMISGLLLGKLSDISEEIAVSILPKSLTTPVAVQISGDLGGIPSLTAVFVMIAGLTGAILGSFILKLFHIKNPVSKGIAMGTASHAIGTSKAFEFGELAFSMSSISMTLSAIFGSVLGPIIMNFFIN